MATISDISQVLGDYMLRGWVLTDQSCPTPGCSVPLVKSPKGRTPITTLCVKCDRSGSFTASRSLYNSVAPPSEISTESRNSRSSTPPTEFSEILDVPAFVPVEESEESRRRRTQSDRASSEIGKKLLQGWAMLGEECPNETCYGVPLVRPPKAGGGKDPRRECVICGNIYVTEIDWAGGETLVPYHLEPTHDGVNQEGRPQTQPSHAPVLKTTPSYQKLSSSLSAVSERREEYLNQSLPSQASSSKDVLHETSQALQASLHALSGRMSYLTSSSSVDVPSIATTADAITKVADAMARVQQLQGTRNA